MKHSLVISLLTILKIISGDSQRLKTTYVYDENSRMIRYGGILSDKHLTFVGGEGFVLKIDRNSRKTEKIKIPVDPNQLRVCHIFYSREPERCSNAIKVIEKNNSTHLVVCGTHLRQPRCYYYGFENNTFSIIDFVLARFFPLIPGSKYNHVGVSDGKTSLLYVVQCKDECSMYRILDRNQLLKTHESDKFFEKPTFINIHTHKRGVSKVYLFYHDVTRFFLLDRFTRNGPSYENSFVARVCHNDEGGDRYASGSFMTSLRARLICRYPGASQNGGQEAVYFDIIQQTFKMNDYVFALFKVPKSYFFQAIAVCVYKIGDIDSVIDGSVFPNNQTKYYSAESFDFTTTYTPERNLFLPGQCPNDQQSTRSIKPTYRIFLSDHPTVAKVIYPINNQAVFISTELSYDFILGSKINSYFILYLFRKNGFLKVLRADNLLKSSVVLSESYIFKTDETIQTVSLADKKEAIFVVTDISVHQLDPAFCANYNNCQSCEADPLCNWRVTEDWFECYKATESDSESIKNCGKRPSMPKNIVVSGNYPLYTVTWEKRSGSVPSESYFIIIRSKEGDLLTREKTSYPSFEIDQSLSTRSSTLTCSIYSVNGLSFSKEPAILSFVSSSKSTYKTCPDIEEQCRICLNSTHPFHATHPNTTTPVLNRDKETPININSGFISSIFWLVTGILITLVCSSPLFYKYFKIKRGNLNESRRVLYLSEQIRDSHESQE